MLFRPHRPLKIEIDPNAIRSNSPEVASRLERIKENYRLLDELLTQVEKIMPVAAPVDETVIVTEILADSPSETASNKIRKRRPKPR